jgi:putative sterol carrier protein
MTDRVAFGTSEWLDEYVRIYNENPNVQEALKDLSARVAFQFLDRPDIPAKYFFIKEGVIVEHGEVADEGAMDFIIRGNYEVWKAVTLGELDPMNALMSGKVKITGNMAALLKHAEGFKQTFEVVEAIPTTFD